MTAEDFAQLLGQPMERLPGYGGGEIEISADDGDMTEEPGSPDRAQDPPRPEGSI